MNLISIYKKFNLIEGINIFGTLTFIICESKKNKINLQTGFFIGKINSTFYYILFSL